MTTSKEGDLAYGAKAIALHLGIRERQARHLIDIGAFPTWKAAKVICARRSALDSWMAECEAKAAAERAGGGS